MKSYVLAHDIYTPEAIDHGILAFAEICTARASHNGDHSIIAVEARDDDTAELLNYILATSAAELLT